MQEAWFPPLGWEDPLEKVMATHSNILAWTSPWGCKRVRYNLLITFTFHIHALEKAMAIHSSVLAWRIPGTGETAVWWLRLWGRTESDMTEAT